MYLIQFNIWLFVDVVGSLHTYDESLKNYTFHCVFTICLQNVYFLLRNGGIRRLAVLQLRVFVFLQNVGPKLVRLALFEN